MTNSPQPATDNTIGILGLGLLSRNLILTIARQGVPVACHDIDPGRISELRKQAQGLPVEVCSTIEEFTRHLRPPRAIVVLMQGGPHLEETFRNLSAHLDAGDLIIDGASYHHIFTPRKREFFAGHGVHFFSTGIAASGHGHDYGCCTLFPELQEICRRIRPIFEIAAATAAGEPCVTFVGQQIVHHLRRLEEALHALPADGHRSFPKEGAA